MKKILFCTLVFALVSTMAACDSGTPPASTIPQSTPATNVSSDEKVSDVASEIASAPNIQSEPEQTEEPVSTAPVVPEMTAGQKNALRTAENYLSFSAFSYSGLIKQLEFEQYSTEDATYAADNCGADWNEQAAKAAQNYLEMTGFSKQGLIDQLEFEGYTNEQATYGAEKAGL